MLNKYKKIILISIILITIIMCILLSILNKKDLSYISYKEFNNELENGNIKSVYIEDDKVQFNKVNDETAYYTENPKFDTFKEKMLLAGVEVKVDSVQDDIGYILDLFFYGVFFGMIGFGAYKLFSITSNNFKIVKKTNVKFDDIAGMDELKKEMSKIVDVLKNPKEFEQKGIRPTKGIILEGNPGNGKTLFAKALAGETNVKFIATKGADFQSAMMSFGARKIRALFKKARKCAPCIIFIDEFDGIGERRNYAGTGVDKENNRIITAMLNEMDGFETVDGILVIAATNSYSSLDPALVRAGRFDLKFRVTNPDYNTRLKLIEIYTKNKKLSENLESKKMADSFENLSCSEIETILNEASMIAILENKEEITPENIIVAARKVNCNINIKKLTK